MNQYENSWSIYKAHSESFQDDLVYYYEFTMGHRSLVAFAGYERVANYLRDRGIDLFANELSVDLINYINLPKKKFMQGVFWIFNREKVLIESLQPIIHFAYS